MRISDWSSDVCSSDLHVIHASIPLPGGSMNAPQHFPTPSGVHDVRLSAQDAHLRLKLFNKDNVLEQRLARAWGLAGEIIPTVAQQFWEGVRRHPRSAISSEPDAVKSLVDIEIGRAHV